MAPKPPRIQTFSYLPERYKDRFRRTVADADTRRAHAGWHDEHWDGRVDATARPFPIRLRFQVVNQDPEAPAKATLKMRPLLDTADRAIRVMASVAAVEKAKLMDVVNNRIGRKESKP